jgi:hypothetical protein
MSSIIEELTEGVGAALATHRALGGLCNRISSKDQ